LVDNRDCNTGLHGRDAFVLGYEMLRDVSHKKTTDRCASSR
jgi:hypothetical protein